MPIPQPKQPADISTFGTKAQRLVSVVKLEKLTPEQLAAVKDSVTEPSK